MNIIGILLLITCFVVARIHKKGVRIKSPSFEWSSKLGWYIVGVIGILAIIFLPNWNFASSKKIKFSPSDDVPGRTIAEFTLKPGEVKTFHLERDKLMKILPKDGPVRIQTMDGVTYNLIKYPDGRKENYSKAKNIFCLDPGYLKITGLKKNKKETEVTIYFDEKKQNEICEASRK